MRRLATMLAAAFAALPAAAQLPGPDQLVPVVAHTAGAGNPPTYWLSDVVIRNLEEVPVTVGAVYLPSDRSNTWDGTFPVTLTLQPNETLLVEDVLGTWFGVSGNEKGFLFISASDEHFPENPAEARLLVTSRTYNTGDPRGTYGQTIAPNLFYWNGGSDLSQLTGIRHGGRYRSNLGVVNISFDEITVHMIFYDEDGIPLASTSRAIPAGSMKQWSLSSLGVPQRDGPISADLWLDPADVTPDPCNADQVTYFVAYVSKVDGNPDGTGDAEFIYATPREFPPAGMDCPE